MRQFYLACFGPRLPTREAKERLDLEVAKVYFHEALGCFFFFRFTGLRNRLFYRWIQGQPDDFNQSQNCLAVSVTASSYGFVDEQCSSLQRYETLTINDLNGQNLKYLVRI
jgi:hypothetical protein